MIGSINTMEATAKSVESMATAITIQTAQTSNMAGDIGLEMTVRPAVHWRPVHYIWKSAITLWSNLDYLIWSTNR